MRVDVLNGPSHSAPKSSLHVPLAVQMCSAASSKVAHVVQKPRDDVKRAPSASPLSDAMQGLVMLSTASQVTDHTSCKW